MRTLALTSPHMHGPDVVEAQHTLASNVFKADFLQGKVDGDCGPETARAFIRAKYWLGYPELQQKPTYGTFLHQYLTGASPLPKDKAKRRADALKALKNEPLASKALKNAVADIGLKENPPGSNRCPISVRWGLIGPWCNMFISEKYIDAGSKAFVLHQDWAYVPAFLQTALMGQHGLSLVRWEYIVPGDAVCFDWNRDGVPDHVGLFENWLQKGVTFQTVEGNTSEGNDSNGGEVMRRQRNVSDVAKAANGSFAFIHVGR